MNKTVSAALSFAVAMSVSVGLADQYEGWFNGIGASPTSLSSLGETGGEWTGLQGEGISFANSRIVLEDVETAINFSITATEPDTEVLDRVEVTMSGLAGAISSLPTSAEMVDGGAQLSVALASDSGVLGYYAWLGGKDWVSLTGATPVEDVDFTLIVEVDYSVASEPRVRFALKGNPDVVLQGPGGEWTQITTTARKFSGVKFGGNGKLAKVDGSVRLGFAKVGGVKYPTIAAAVAAAKTGTDKNVQVIRKTSENVDMTGAGDVVLADGGNMTGTVTVPSDQPVKIAPAVGEFTLPESSITGASGEYTLATKISGGVITAADITLPADIAQYKEIAKVEKDGTAVKVTLQTKDTIVGAVSVGGRTLKVTDGLKTFLANKVAAYTAPESSTANLQKALEANGEKNNLPVWQSYVLGLDPEVATSVPKFEPLELTTEKDSTEALFVKVPAVNPPKDSGYTVVFRLYDNGVAKGTDYTDPESIPLPLDGAAHAYTIKPVIISAE